MAMRPWVKKAGILVVIVGVGVGGYNYAKTHGLFDHKQAEQSVDTGNEQPAAIAQPQARLQQAEAAQPAPQPVQEAPAPAPQQSADPEVNRGMKALLNAGKSN